VEHRGVLALFGVLSVIAGIVLVRHPFAAVIAVALFVGVWLITFGTVRVIDVIDVAEHRIWWLAVAIIEILAGVSLAAYPGVGVAAAALIIGIAFIVRGVALCSTAWALRRLEHELPHSRAGASRA
jgi:uncharacterized membrane protein HdeD (DUF308 family)